jgi:quercetin dioxygenase-like cupin family protein
MANQKTAVVIDRAQAPLFEIPNLVVTGLASPSRGAAETCVWRLALAPGAPGVAHAVTREEIFVVLAGRALATVDGVEHTIQSGDTLIVPRDTTFALANPHPDAFEAMVAFPVGGQAVTGAGTFTPPWAK